MSHKDYIQLFREAVPAKSLVHSIHRMSKQLDSSIHIMEVCGTHTMSISKFGIRDVLPDNIKLISGPGCPVCVTVTEYIDKAIWLSRQSNVVICTFGDLLKVPGSRTSLAGIRAEGSDIRVVYSPMDALFMAEEDSTRQFVFLAVGFETTVPVIAATIQESLERKLKNFSFLFSLKVIPEPMIALLQDPEIQIHAYLCPAHVSAIIGAKSYQCIADDFHIPCVIAGFESLDVLYGIMGIMEQIISGEAKVDNRYERIVKWEGNEKAQTVISQVFEKQDADWRGLGMIPQSGLQPLSSFRHYNAESRYDIPKQETKDNPACLCGDVLKGKILPNQCPLFGKVCLPHEPVGPCMVSSEGTCAAYYKYGVKH